MKNVLAIDIGGSKLLVGVVSEFGDILKQEKYVFSQSYTSTFLIDKIISMAQKQLKFAPCAIGASIPGLIDRDRGVWLYSPFSRISDIPIAQMLKQRLGLPVFVENDVNACAIGEAVYGECRKTNNFLWITVSNGIGSGIVLNGNLYRGGEGHAGEIGHFVVEENTNIICGCGNTGCLEAMASGRAISNCYKKMTGTMQSAAEIAALARSGNCFATKAFSDAGYYIGKGISYCANMLNLEKVILGGGVAQSFELLRDSLWVAMDKYIFKAANKNIVVKQTALGYYASLKGCAAIARKGIE